MAWVITEPGVPSKVRNAALWKRACCGGCWRYVRKPAAAWRLRSSTQGALRTTYGLSERSVPSFG